MYSFITKLYDVATLCLSLAGLGNLADNSWHSKIHFV